MTQSNHTADAGSNSPDQDAPDESEDLSLIERGGVDTDARAGSSQHLDPHEEPDEDTKQEIEKERDQRLDPENRPDNVEIDNTEREFDVDRGMFTDAEEYDDSAPAPFNDPEDPNQSGDDVEEPGNDTDESENPGSDEERAR